MEYQAKELFAKHGVPVTLGTVVENADDAAAAAEALGGKVVVKAQVKIGGRGKAGGVKLAQDPQEAVARAGRHPRHGHQGPHRPPGAARPDSRHRRGVLLLLPGRPGQPELPVHREHRGRCRDRGGRAHQPRRGRQGLHRPGHRRRRRQGGRDRRRHPLPGRRRRPGQGRRQEAVGRLHQGGRLAGRGEPAGPAGRRHPRGARRQGHARRERRLPARRPRRVRGQGRGGPARGEGQGEGPQLRQARRRGRHHRQRRRAGHVDARRGRLRRRGARRRQAGELPRHRWRRLGRR